eukprot:4797589-Prymnesium_polylepis.1
MAQRQQRGQGTRAARIALSGRTGAAEHDEGILEFARRHAILVGDDVAEVADLPLGVGGPAVLLAVRVVDWPGRVAAVREVGLLVDVEAVRPWREALDLERDHSHIALDLDQPDLTRDSWPAHRRAQSRAAARPAARLETTDCHHRLARLERQQHVRQDPKDKNAYQRRHRRVWWRGRWRRRRLLEPECEEARHESCNIHCLWGRRWLVS